MWILHFLKEVLNSSFDFFIQKVKGRFLAFAIQLIVSYLAVALFTLLITSVMVAFMSQGGFSLDLFSINGLFEWMRMIDPVWVVTIVIAVNYLGKSDASNESMSFPDFYKGRSSAFWLDLVIAVAVLSVILTIYYKNELMLSFEPNPLVQLLNEGLGGIKTPFQSLLSSWIYYTIISLPVITHVIIEVRDRKRNGLQLKLALWKVVIATLLLSFIVSWTFDNLLYIFGELVMNLIYAPFELIEIPAVLSVIVSILFETIIFIVVAATIHFGIQYGMEENPNAPVASNIKNEPLKN